KAMGTLLLPARLPNRIQPRVAERWSAFGGGDRAVAALVREHSRHVQEARSGKVEQRTKRVVENVLDAGSAGVGPDLPDSADEAGGGPGALGRVGYLQRVESYPAAWRRRLEQDQIVAPVHWHEPKNFRCEVAMRVDEA